jgi:hypothetical protein
MPSKKPTRNEARFGVDAGSSGRKAKDRLMKKQFGYVPTVANMGGNLGSVDAWSGAAVTQGSAELRYQERKKQSQKNKQKTGTTPSINTTSKQDPLRKMKYEWRF